MANNLTLKIMANLAAKKGIEAPRKDAENASIPVRHLDEREESVLLGLIGEVQKPDKNGRTEKNKNAAAGVISLDELAGRL